MHGVDLVIGLIAHATHSYALLEMLAVARQHCMLESLPHFPSVFASQRTHWPYPKNNKKPRPHTQKSPPVRSISISIKLLSRLPHGRHRGQNRLFLFGLSLPSGFIIMFSARARSPLSVRPPCPPAPEQQQKNQKQPKPGKSNIPRGNIREFIHSHLRRRRRRRRGTLWCDGAMRFAFCPVCAFMRFLCCGRLVCALFAVARTNWATCCRCCGCDQHACVHKYASSISRPTHARTRWCINEINLKTFSTAKHTEPMRHRHRHQQQRFQFRQRPNKLPGPGPILAERCRCRTYFARYARIAAVAAD